MNNLDSKTPLETLAARVFERISLARAPVGVYLDAQSVFRVTPVSGHRFQQTHQDFPDSIIGVYTPKISYADFEADFLWFGRQLGLRNLETLHNA